MTEKQQPVASEYQEIFPEGCRSTRFSFSPQEQSSVALPAR
jgi:hypothetical protein